jgi:probable HAF family extracellular repeat protein
MDVPDAASTVAFAINDRGQVAGYFTDATGAIHGFVKTGARIRQLDMPGAAATIVTALNNRGDVAGEYFDAGGARHGFLAVLE